MNLNFPGFFDAVEPGHRVFLADGAVELTIEECSGLSLLACVSRDKWHRMPLTRCGFEATAGSIPTYVGKVNVHSATGVNASQWSVSLGDGDALFGVGP